MDPGIRALSHRRVWIYALLGSVGAWGIAALIDMPCGAARRASVAPMPPWDGVGGPSVDVDVMEAATISGLAQSTPAAATLAPPWRAVCDWKPRYAPAPVVEISVRWPMVVGSLAESTVRRGIKRDIGKIATCYETPLRYRPSLAGMVQLSFSIDARGHVAIDHGAGDLPEVGACVAGVVAAIDFPPPPGGSAVQVVEQIDFSTAR